MLLQSHDRMDVVAEYDFSSNQLVPMPRPADLSVGDEDGFFCILAGVVVAFYRRKGHLWLTVGDRHFDLDGQASVDWSRHGTGSVFAVADPEGQVVLKYQPREGRCRDDPTPGVEDEQYDLGLFVAQVMLDEERSELVRGGTP